MISEIDIIWAEAENEKEKKIVFKLRIGPFQTASSN